MKDRKHPDGLDRRDFLKTAAAGALAMGLPVPLVHAAGAQARREGRVLVTIFLRGGLDPLNAVVPYGDRNYYAMRPTIAIPAEDGEEGEGVLPLDAMFGLHPALAPLKPLWDEKRFAPLLNVGSPHPTRSHFDAMDFMEYAAPGMRNVREGWLNRYLQVPTGRRDSEPELRALAMQGLLPRALRGGYPVLAVPDGPPRRREGVLDDFEDLYGEGCEDMGMEREKQAAARAGRRGAPEEDPVLAAGRVTIQALRRYREVAERPLPAPEGVSYPRGGLGARLRRIAQVLKAGEPLEVACADYGGWDHHANQGGNEGTMARMLGHLAAALAAFARDLGPHLDRTVVLAMTEFGRTCRENGNSGTDHGRGGMMLALGGPVRGGRVFGRWTGLEDRHLYEGRDLPVTADFRDVMSEVLTRHLGATLPRDFFPDYRPGRGMGLLA